MPALKSPRIQFFPHPVTVLLSSDSPTERERTERLIKTKLREIMMQKDLENITSKEVSGEGAAVQMKGVLCAVEKGQKKKKKQTHVVSLCSSTHPDTHGAGDADGVQPAGVQRVH